MPRILAEQQLGNGAFRYGVCLGEVVGVWHAAAWSGWVCSPPGAINDEAVRIVIQYIDARPARLHEDFALLAAEALKVAWPCRKL
jgi:hypothetical protein